MKALKLTLLFLSLAILGVVAFLMFSAMKAPYEYLQDFKNEVVKADTNKMVLSYPDALLEQRTSLSARLAMSDDDSIGLRINLKDQLMYLEIEGIILHEIPIKQLKTSILFQHLTVQEKAVLFSKPLAIQKDESTIAKDNWNIVYAPKDTIEANLRADAVPDTVLREPVFYSLFLEHGIRLQVTGELADTIDQFKSKFKFSYGDRISFIRQLVGNISKKSALPYHPTISVFIDAKEAESVYRALPKNGFVALEW